jgi:hypothetical protein
VEELPKNITVMRVETYNVELIIDYMKEEREYEEEEITLKTILEELREQAREDFGVDSRVLIYKDENGTEL